MNKNRKEHLNSLWQDTLCGKWVLAAAKGNEAEAKKIGEQIASAYPFLLANAEKLLVDEIASEFKPGEFSEYLDALNDENPELVAFMISQDIFGELY